MLCHAGSPLNMEAIRELIDRYKSKNEYLKLMAKKFGRASEAYAQIARAEAMVSEDFANTRRHTGEEYVEHPRSVSIIGLMYCGEKDPKSIISDLLHDSVEDTERTIEMIRQTFGRRVAHTVAGQTKPPLPEQGSMKKEQFDELCSRIIFEHLIAYGIHPMRGKCRDRFHNLITLWGPPEKKLAKIKESLEFMLPVAININYLWPELTMATAEQLERLSVDDTLGLVTHT